MVGILPIQISYSASKCSLEAQACLFVRQEPSRGLPFAFERPRAVTSG